MISRYMDLDHQAVHVDLYHHKQALSSMYLLLVSRKGMIKHHKVALSGFHDASISPYIGPHLNFQLFINITLTFYETWADTTQCSSMNVYVYTMIGWRKLTEVSLCLTVIVEPHTSSASA